jgi:hypothetical protein
LSSFDARDPGPVPTVSCGFSDDTSADRFDSPRRLPAGDKTLDIYRTVD